MKRKKQRPPMVEREFRQRVDGNVNIWERRMGKFDWNPWQVIKVLVREKHGKTA